MKTFLFAPLPVRFARLLLGLILVPSGLNPFLHLYPLPPASPPADALMHALVASGYVFQLVKVLEILVGLLLLTNRLVPLALVIFAPIAVNIFLFNTLLWPVGAPIGALVLTLTVYLLLAHRATYQPLLRWRPALAPPSSID